MTDEERYRLNRLAEVAAADPDGDFAFLLGLMERERVVSSNEWPLPWHGHG